MVSHGIQTLVSWVKSIHSDHLLTRTIDLYGCFSGEDGLLSFRPIKIDSHRLLVLTSVAKGQHTHTDTDRGGLRFKQKHTTSAMCHWGLQHKIHALRAEEGVIADISVTRMFGWWHMVGWWRHVLLSQIHQRPLPYDFIIPFKFLSYPEATFFSEGKV